MKKILFNVLLSQLLIVGVCINSDLCHGQEAPAISVRLVVGELTDQNVFIPRNNFPTGMDIYAVISLENVGTSDVITTTDFERRKFHHFLKFTSDRGETITSTFFTEKGDIMPPPEIKIIDGKSVQAEAIAILPVGPPPWYWRLGPTNLNLYNFYPLKCRKYTASVISPIRTYLESDIHLIYGTKYAAIEDAYYAGALFSNSVEFTVSEEFCSAGFKPQILEMQYTGLSCSDSNNSQSDWTCEGDPDGTNRVRIRVTDKSDPFHHLAKVWFDGEVELFGTFEINSNNETEPRLGGTTFVSIFKGETLLQKLSFHTSCSEPLSCGDTFGSLELLDFIPENK